MMEDVIGGSIVLFSMCKSDKQFLLNKAEQ